MTASQCTRYIVLVDFLTRKSELPSQLCATPYKINEFVKKNWHVHAQAVIVTTLYNEVLGHVSMV